MTFAHKSLSGPGLRPRRRYLGTITVSNGRSIIRVVDLDGRKLDPQVAYRRARRKLKEALLESNGRAASLYTADAMTDGSTITYGSRTIRESPDMCSHERFHIRVESSLRSLRERACLPLEESAAYAVGSVISSEKHERDADKLIRRRTQLGLHTLRVLQCIEHGERNGIFSSSLGVLYENARGFNRNIAWALDIAANYMFYRECLAVIEKFGIKEAEGIFLDALACADSYGLPKAWRFLLKQVSRSDAAELKSSIKLPGKPIVIRTPYAPTHTSEFIYL